jgi:hypothetical protein
MRSSVSIVMLSLAGALALSACSKKEENKTTTTSSSATVEAPAPTPTPAPTPSAAPEIETSAEMKGFMAMLDGSDASAGKALKKYGAKSLKSDLDMYSLKDPKVTKSEKLGVMQCYTMSSVAGIVKHTTRLCWDTSGKIAQVTDKLEP